VVVFGATPIAEEVERVLEHIYRNLPYLNRVLNVRRKREESPQSHTVTEKT
jgi:hypothetical protein